MALTQISTEGIKNGTITGSDLATNVDLVDNQKLRLGTGNDLQIYHNGSHSYIDDAGTGNLYIRSSQLVLQNAAGDEDLAILTSNGAVKLYFNDSKKFETTSAGVNVSGNIRVPDNENIMVGTHDDLQIIHTPNNSFIKNTTGGLFIQGGTQNNSIYIRPREGEDSIKANSNGAVELYHDNSKKFETFANGITVSSDNAQLEIESSSSGTSTAFGVFKGYRIVADVGRLAELQFINQRDNDVQAEIEVIANGDTNSYFDFKTSNAGLRSLRIHNTGTHLPDNFTANYGNSNDLQIYHDGSNSYIDDTATGNLVIRSNQINFDKYTGEALARFRADGNCELFHNNVSKFETTSSGVTISGTTIANGHIRVRDHTGTEDGQIMLGAGNDLRIYHDGAHSYLDNSTGSFFVRGDTIKLRGKSADEDLIEAFVNGSVRLYYDNSTKLETFADGIKVVDDGSVVEIELITNSSAVRGKVTADSGNQVILATATDENMLIAKADGAVELYHDNVKKLETTSGGAKVSGDLDVVGHAFPNANNTYDLGTSGNRWRNIYTNDLNLSNEGGANDVDGTWGSYTIQEGAEDLFLD